MSSFARLASGVSFSTCSSLHGAPTGGGVGLDLNEMVCQFTMSVAVEGGPLDSQYQPVSTDFPADLPLPPKSSSYPFRPCAGWPVAALPSALPAPSEPPAAPGVPESFPLPPLLLPSAPFATDFGTCLPSCHLKPGFAAKAESQESFFAPGPAWDQCKPHLQQKSVFHKSFCCPHLQDQVHVIVAKYLGNVDL